MVTTKKLHPKSIVHELLWFIAGDTNVKYLQDNGVSGMNGRMKTGRKFRLWYQWRQWKSNDGRIIDQLEQAIEILRQTLILVE